MQNEIAELAEAAGVDQSAAVSVLENTVSLMIRDGVKVEDFDTDTALAYLAAAQRQNRMMAERAYMRPQQTAHAVLKALKA